MNESVSHHHVCCRTSAAATRRVLSGFPQVIPPVNFEATGRTVYESEPATPSVRIAGTMEMEEGRSGLRTSAQGDLGQNGRWRAPPVETQPHPHASRETPAWQPRSESRMPKDAHWLAILGHFRNRQLWPTKPPSDSLRVPDLPIMPLRPLLLPLPPRLLPPPHIRRRPA